MRNSDLAITQKLQVPESMQDVWRSDPLQAFKHREDHICIICGAPVSGDVYCPECLELETKEAEQAPPVFIAEGMEED